MLDARNFKRGDRVRLLRMDDEYAGSFFGKNGTVVGICPPPINVVDVDWDDGFWLNPCLDVDVIEKVEQ